jgi:hypothetical protein
LSIVGINNLFFDKKFSAKTGVLEKLLPKYHQKVKVNRLSFLAQLVEQLILFIIGKNW